jgi:phosphatidylglycerophosphate synthase
VLATPGISKVGTAPVYKADDRSIFLPYYKRFFVEPSLPLIPVRLDPNTITHFGHLVNLLAVGLLAALHPRRGWVFIGSMILLQVYTWADNADGAHARRTNQSSALGEFLDHGLDILNTSYIALMTVLALGSSHEWAVALVIIIPGAASLTCWEQTETGVFRLGLLNQIESVMVLSAVMIVDATLGIDVLRQVHVGPVTLWYFMHAWPAATVIFGMLRGVQRVHASHASVMPAVAFLALHGLVFSAAYQHLLSTLAAVCFALAVNIFWGARMLSLRLSNERARVEPVLVGGIVGMGGFFALSAAGLGPAHDAGVGLAVTACVVYAIFSLREARDGLASLARIEPASSRRRPTTT